MSAGGLSIGDLRALARAGNVAAIRAIGAYVKHRRKLRSALERARRQRRRRSKNGGSPQ